MAKEPIQYILNNIDAIYTTYIENNKKPKATYEGLKAGVISDIETHIEFKTFNSRIKPIMETYEFFNNKPIKTDNVNPEIETLKAELDTAREANEETLRELDTVTQENTVLFNENDKLKSELGNLQTDLQLKDNELDKINQYKVNSEQEINHLNSEIARLNKELQYKTEKVNQIDSDRVNSVNHIETKEGNPMINEMLQRIEQLEKAVFVQENGVGVNQGVNINHSEVNQEGNLFDKRINSQNKPEKVKIGKWNITRRGNTYRAYRNFGAKGEIKGVKAVYVGKDLNKAEDKITAKGFPID